MKKTILLFSLFFLLSSFAFALGESEGTSSNSGQKSDFDYGMKMEAAWSSNPDFHWHEAVDRQVRKDVAPHSGSPCTVCSYACTDACILPGQRGPGGGIIFYHNHKGFTVQGYGSPGQPGYFATYTAYYLEVAPANERYGLEWGNFATPEDMGGGITVIDSNNKNELANPASPARNAIGNGRRDTQIIVAFHTRVGMRLKMPEQSYAAKVCADKRLGGFSDWFLPSLGELRLLYKARGQASGILSNAPRDGKYKFWSSTSGDGSGGAWYQSFFEVGYDPAPGLNARNANATMERFYTRAIRAF
jgi:hypothetical protein